MNLKAECFRKKGVPRPLRSADGTDENHSTLSEEHVRGL